MSRFVLLLPVSLLLFSCCKSNEKAYNAAYQKLKEKNEEIALTERAKTAETISDEVINRQTSGSIKATEVVTLILGEETHLSKYSIVIKSFINKTNARSLYSRMIEEGHPAVLVQNKELMYRIIIESCRYEQDADRILSKVKQSWPDAWILVRF